MQVLLLLLGERAHAPRPAQSGGGRDRLQRLLQHLHALRVECVPVRGLRGRSGALDDVYDGVDELLREQQARHGTAGRVLWESLCFCALTVDLPNLCMFTIGSCSMYNVDTLTMSCEFRHHL